MGGIENDDLRVHGQGENKQNILSINDGLFEFSVIFRSLPLLIDVLSSPKLQFVQNKLFNFSILLVVKAFAIKNQKILRSQKLITEIDTLRLWLIFFMAYPEARIREQKV